MKKTALISGITGQDGSYLAEFLLRKGYEVHGIKRRTSLFNTDRIDHLYEDPHVHHRNFILHYGDLTDSSSLVHIVQKVQPDEVYNLGAQSHVAVSFEQPEYTADVDAMGTLRLLEAIRILGLEKKTRFYQASTSELFGLVQQVPQTEKTPFYPRSPYAVAKLYAYWITVNYRESYGMYACNGILFNHESPTRGETFVTRITARWLASKSVCRTVSIGNMNALRDWGHARDYVEVQWPMLHRKPENFVIATGRQHSVREFVSIAAADSGMKLTWTGSGPDEKVTDENGQVIVAVHPRYCVPRKWKHYWPTRPTPRSTRMETGDRFRELVREMVQTDLEEAKRDALVRKHGFRSLRAQRVTSDQHCTGGSIAGRLGNGLQRSMPALVPRVSDDFLLAT